MRVPDLSTFVNLVELLQGGSTVFVGIFLASGFFRARLATTRFQFGTYKMMEQLVVLIKFFPIGSMYGIFTYIYHENQPNVGEYTIHGSYGFWMAKKLFP